MTVTGLHFSALQMIMKLMAWVACSTLTAVAAQSKPRCESTCGNVTIPYPFGTREGCYKDESFIITCSATSSSGHSTPKLSNGNIQVLDISLHTGELRVLAPVSRECFYNDTPSGFLEDLISLPLEKFSISNTRNKFTVVGCDTFAYIKDINRKTYVGFCMSNCSKISEVGNGSCSGVGCCEATFPKPIIHYNLTLVSLEDNRHVRNFSPCGYAFLAENGSFNFTTEDFLNLRKRTEFPVVLNWNVDSETCAVAKKNTSTYACKDNSICRDSEFGYLCQCRQGFDGNPYLPLSPHGCQDVDECSTKNPCNISTRCRNFIGGYTCSCPRGYKGDGKINGSGCTLDNKFNQLLLVQIALGITVALLVVFALLSSLCWVHKQRTLKQLRRRYFEQNGGTMLLQQLSQQRGYSDRTKIFTQVELEEATNNFNENRILGRGGQGTVYNGILSDNTPVAIKKSRVGGDPRQIKDFINEVAVLSQINHRNVVKLFGCCLETEVPLLVYEFVDNGTLLDHIDPLKNECSIPWETRLMIAAETAEAVSYLHSAASIPIIHRDIKSANILLDHNHRAKVSDFGASRLVPLDETQVTTVVQGTLGYLDPEYLHTGQLNEKSDVYSFGVVLVELLTGNKAVEFSRPEQRNLAMYFVSSMKEDRLWEVLDRRVLNQKKNAEQLKEVALLARRCLSVKGEERPSMKEVAMELEGLIAMEKHLWVKGEDLKLVENESLLGNVPDLHGAAGSSNSASSDTIQKQMAFEIADGR